MPPIITAARVDHRRAFIRGAFKTEQAAQSGSDGLIIMPANQIVTPMNANTRRHS